MEAWPVRLDLGDLESGVAGGDGDPGHLQAVGHGGPITQLVKAEPATTNQTRSSWQASRHFSARIRCPRWIGSNVPPNRPSRIVVLTFFGKSRIRLISCGQVCRIRVAWRLVVSRDVRMGA